MFIRVLVGLIGIPLGIVIMIYKDRIVLTAGKMELAERYLGEGGTYNAWVIIGMLVSAGSFLYLVGLFPGQ